ncbi:MAG TPA: diguanylate cyclase [Steroidobacteraceae bacterium]|nr:diguanylate cyclase [Steroidobacteraceae bacterium]
MHQLDGAFFQRVLDSAPEGIAVCDATAPDHPVVYVNAAYEQLTGYSTSEMLGSNLRLLQGTDREQEGLRRLRECISRGESCRVLLRNYRKSGGMFWNELTLQPLRDETGRLTHFIAYCRDAAGRLRQADKGQEGLPGWLREDRITGLSSRAWFNELLDREWLIARREQKALTLVLYDIDALGSYNATYGKSGGDACFRRIARSIAGGFRRGSDVVGIWREGCIGVLAVHRDGEGVSGIVDHAAGNVRRIADMKIHHPRSPLQKFVTVTAGLATVLPDREEETPGRLVQRVEKALQEAKRDLRGGLNQAPD